MTEQAGVIAADGRRRPMQVTEDIQSPYGAARGQQARETEAGRFMSVLAEEVSDVKG